MSNSIKSIYYILLASMVILFTACKQEQETIPTKTLKPNQVVLISLNAPEKYVHFIKQDSIGKILTDSIGPRAFWNVNGFSYTDYMNNVKNWKPKPNIPDTLIIETYNDYLELSTNNFFTSIKDTFLVKNGDTVIFSYHHSIPNATIANRDVNDVELNYNSYRHKTLFDNKYTSHYLIFGNLFLNNSIEDYEQQSIDNYQRAQLDYTREVQLLDSLNLAKVISQTNYHYRLDALNMLMEKHKNIKNINKWIEQNKSSNEREKIEQIYGFDLTHTDSLMKFSFFRDYLNTISQYNLKFIEENNGNSGGFYIDSRIRFDSILNDSRFNQTAKNFLLFSTYQGIGQNFRVKDKETYFKKLQQHTTNIEQLNNLKEEFKLDFNTSDKLILTTIDNDTLTYAHILENNKGKWLYIDFWASWCKPCLNSMPESKALNTELHAENIEFIYLSLNDQKDGWKKAIDTYQLAGSQHYFIENGNVSKVIEELGIKTIPHYLIYNPSGILVNGFASRPGQGAKEQLKKLLEN